MELPVSSQPPSISSSSDSILRPNLLTICGDQLHLLTQYTPDVPFLWPARQNRQGYPFLAILAQGDKSLENPNQNPRSKPTDKNMTQRG